MPEFKDYRKHYAYFDRFDIASAYALFTIDWQCDMCFYNFGLRDQLENNGENLLPASQQEKINGYYSRVTAGRCQVTFGAMGARWDSLSENAKYIYANLCIKYGYELPDGCELPSDED